MHGYPNPTLSEAGLCGFYPRLIGCHVADSISMLDLEFRSGQHKIIFLDKQTTIRPVLVNC